MDGSNHLLKRRDVLTLLRDIEFSWQILLFLKHNDPLSFLKSRFQADDYSPYLVNNYKNWDLALTETMKCWAISSSEMIMKISFSGGSWFEVDHVSFVSSPEANWPEGSFPFCHQSLLPPKSWCFSVTWNQ